VLRFDKNAFDEHVASGREVGDEGVENAFEVIADIHEG
jgi:hypothetical protein